MTKTRTTYVINKFRFKGENGAMAHICHYKTDGEVSHRSLCGRPRKVCSQVTSDAGSIPVCRFCLSILERSASLFSSPTQSLP